MLMNASHEGEISFFGLYRTFVTIEACPEMEE